MEELGHRVTERQDPCPVGMSWSPTVLTPRPAELLPAPPLLREASHTDRACQDLPRSRTPQPTLTLPLHPRVPSHSSGAGSHLRMQGRAEALAGCFIH